MAAGMSHGSYSAHSTASGLALSAFGYAYPVAWRFS
jgi:hypothetical protein